MNRVFPDLKIVIAALQYPPVEEEYTWFGNTVIPFNTLRHNKILRPWLWKKVYNRLCKIECSGGTGVLSFWYSDTALIGKYVAQKKGLPHYCWISGQDARKENRYPIWVKLKPGELIAMSDFLQEEMMRSHGVRPQTVVYNGTDPSLFENNTIEKTIDVVGVGSLIPLKQYSVFVDIVAQIKATNPEVKTVICGRGPEDEQLRTLIHKLNLQQNISLMGEVSHKGALTLMQQSKVFLHPSSYEGYSSACLEALYAGCHVISFTRAEKRDIDHWHVVSSTEEMRNKCLQVLKGDDYSSVLVHHIEDSARKIMDLFIRK
jgi:glycosyltransferase involved in cell wall biosynthesis